MNNTPIHWTKKLNRLKTQIDKQIDWAPQVKTIYLVKKDYDEVIKLIPNEAKKHMCGNPFYRQREIKIY